MEAVASASDQDAVSVVHPVDAPASAELRTSADPGNSPHLAAGEVLLVGPLAAVFTRVSSDGTTSVPIAGTLYVTSTNLIQAGPHAGAVERVIDLRRITELGLTAGRILITIARSRGLVVEVDSAQDVRALIADAISARRQRRRSSLVPVMTRSLRPVPDAELVEDVADVAAHSTGRDP